MLYAVSLNTFIKTYYIVKDIVYFGEFSMYIYNEDVFHCYL